MGQKPLERGSGYRSPHQPRNDRGLGGVKGVQIGVRFPFFQQALHVPAPCVGTIDHVETSARRREVGQQGVELLRLAVPADE